MASNDTDDILGAPPLSPVWAGEITAETRQLRRDFTRLQNDLNSGMQGLRDDLKNLQSQMWYLVIAALVGPSVAYLITRVVGG